MAGRSVSSSSFSSESSIPSPNPRKPGAPLLSVDHRLDVALRAAVNQKALDVRALDVSHATDIADRFIILSGTSQRHVRSIADKISEALTRIGEEPASVNGYEEAEWVLLDYGDLIVHIFYEPTRQYYNLEDFWHKRGKLIQPAADLEEEIRRLRTGISWGSDK